MKINIYALVAAALMLVSLFLPWVSYSQTIALSSAFMGIMSVAYTPFQMNGDYTVWNTSSNLIAARYVFHSRIQPTWYMLNVWITPQGYLVNSFLVSMLCLLAIILLMHVSFASGSWSETGRRIAMTGSNLAFLGIFIYVMLSFWSISSGKSNGMADWMRNGGIAFYLNSGFWLAIFGSLAAYISWVQPKFICIETRVRTGRIEAFKRLLPVSEWQKTAVIAVSSFLVIFIFAIVHLLLMPAEF